MDDSYRLPAMSYDEIFFATLVVSASLPGRKRVVTAMKVNITELYDVSNRPLLTDYEEKYQHQDAAFLHYSNDMRIWNRKADALATTIAAAVAEKFLEALGDRREIGGDDHA